MRKRSPDQFFVVDETDPRNDEVGGHPPIASAHQAEQESQFDVEDMAPDAIVQIARALRQVRSRITAEERKHLTAEIASLRRVHQSVMADRKMLLEDAANSNAREQLALRVASFYRRLGTLEEAVERLRRN